MTLFTDSPFERMMIQKPNARRENIPPALPKEGRCNGCTFRREGCCSATCYRDLAQKKNKEAEKCDL
jgi:hypothetical protein